MVLISFLRVFFSTRKINAEADFLTFTLRFIVAYEWSDAIRFLTDILLNKSRGDLDTHTKLQ